MLNNHNNMETESNVEEQQTPLPSPEQVMGMIDQMHKTITHLQGWMQAKTVKTRPPEPFNSTWSKLRGFLTQLELYMQIHREKLVHKADKVLFATTYLTRPAFDWFEPVVWDYQENSTARQEDTMQEIFDDFKKFKKHLQGTFRDINTK